MSEEARPARRRVTIVFLAHGLLQASWTAHIPHVKLALGLSDGGLGLVLLGAPVGSLLAGLLGGALLPRLGSRRAVQVTILGAALVPVLLGLARSPLAVAGSLALWGLFLGMLDIAMNTQGIAVERALARPIMSSLHAAWSLGSFAGAGLGALAVALGVSLTAQALVLGPLAVLVVAAVPGRLLADRAADVADAGDAASDPGDAASEPVARPSAALRSAAVWLLGAIAVAGMLCEGAAADWSAVWLRGSLHAPGGLAGLGYAAFAAAMVTVRLAGDRLLAARPPALVLSALALVATAGMAAGLLIAEPAAALAGLACLGVGLALVVPAAFSAAGRLPRIPTGTAVAAVSAIGWLGIVGGPPIIGRLAAAVTLPTALILLPVLTAVIAVAVRLAPPLRATVRSPSR